MLRFRSRIGPNRVPALQRGVDRKPLQNAARTRGNLVGNPFVFTPRHGVGATMDFVQFVPAFQPRPVGKQGKTVMLLRDYTLAHARTKVRGIFCLETDWSEVRTSPSVEPMLALLKSSPLAIPFVHRNVVTIDTLDYYLKKWTQRRHDDFPILYLAFHGIEGEVQFGDLRRRSARVSLDQLEESLRGRCAGRVIHFGCCQTLGVSQRRLRKFIEETGALAVSGYEKDIDWVRSAMLDFTLFASIQQNTMTVSGLRAVQRRMQLRQGREIRSLAFRMALREPRRV